MRATESRGDGASTASTLRVSAPGLDTLRSSIDRIDGAAADLLVRRARMARRVALLKLLEGRAQRDLGRERQVREHYASILRRAGWSEKSLDSWLETMLSASRDLQARLAVAIQGTRGSWSETSLQAALPGIGASFADTVDEAWRRCRKGEVDAVWLAARNSTVGEVQATADVRREAECWAEYDQPIRHALLGPRGSRLEEVEAVEAHPLAFEQCRSSLARLVPGARLVPAVDGAHAAGTLDARPGTLVLADARIAPAFGLAVLQDAVNDAPDNRTTFQLLLPKEIF